ncbi:MAG: hypothetical protein RLZZ383_1638 [Pseudomonadota bacterium]
MRLHRVVLVLACHLVACAGRDDDGAGDTGAAPSQETPSVEDTPSTDTPSTDTPSTDTPSTDTPDTDVEESGAPSVDTPDTDPPPPPACAPGDGQACYTGPSGTLAVGACQAGVAACLSDGSGFGPCVGDVLPAAVDACDGVDDDCDGAVDNAPDPDGDGFTVCDGDCCEDVGTCPRPGRVNPSSVELPTPAGEVAVDDDCDGQVDEPATCDVGFALNDPDPFSAAAALGLCGEVGLAQAAWTGADGRALVPGEMMGITTSFGAFSTPREGPSILVLSTGRARDATQPGACGTATCDDHRGFAPPGFPQGAPGCPVATSIEDDVALQVTLDVPANAEGLAFDYRFFTFDFPESVCTQFADEFAAMLNPAPRGAVNADIARDAFGNPVSANTFLEHCLLCQNGTAELQGTGFDVWDTGGATSWRTVSAPVTPGSRVNLRLALWDSFDGQSDSTILLDHFRWLGAPP